jgi:hypothetical protein
MTSRLPKSSLVALSLTVAVTAMALGGLAYAQTGTQTGTMTGRSLGDANINAPRSTGGSLRNAPDNEATDQTATGQPATEEETAEPAMDEAPPADEPQAEADEDTTPDRRC